MMLSVYHQCYKNKKATIFAAQKFLSYNSEVPYFLWSDAGDNYSDVESLSPFITAKFSSYNVGYNNYSSEKLLELFYRIKFVADNTNCDLIVWMEDDVLTRGKLNIKANVKAACISSLSNKLPNECLDLVRTKYQREPLQDWWGMAGGSLLNADLFRNNWEEVKEFALNDYPSLVKSCGSYIGHGDIVLQMIHLILGIPCDPGTYVKQYRARNKHSIIKRIADLVYYSSTPLLHNYKKMYS